jgi:integrase
MFNIRAKQTPPKENRVPYIPLVKEDNTRRGFFEHGEFLALRDTLPSYLKGFVTFAYYTGWRRSEIFSLQWSQVDLEEGIVRLEPGDTKNSEGRTLYLEPALLELMRNLKRKQRLGCPYVFHLSGKRIGDFRDAWSRACQIARTPGMLFHDFRRTAIRNMIRAGIPERVAMTISGQKTRAVFDRYNIVSQDDLKEAASKRQVFNEKMAERWLQNGYTTPLRKKLGNVRLC